MHRVEAHDVLIPLVYARGGKWVSNSGGLGNGNQITSSFHRELIYLLLTYIFCFS